MRKIKIIIVHLLVLVFVVISHAANTSRDIYKQVRKNQSLINDVYRHIITNYVDDIDLDAFTKMSINNMLLELDPYTTYMEKEEKDGIEMLTKGKYGGVGIQIGLREKQLTVISPMDQSPAKRAGILSGDNLVDAKPRMDNQSNQTVVTFSLDRVGAKKFGKATSTGVGKQLAIVLDGKIISAPSVREPIIGGSGQISGDFTFQSATDLALLLRSGALPAPLNIIEERTVGPDLGKDSIKAGIIALILGFFLLIVSSHSFSSCSPFLPIFLHSSSIS